MEYRYRTITRAEENSGERYFADRSVEIFSKKLGLRNVQVRFLEEDLDGEHVFSNPIAGFCPPTTIIGQTIYIRRGRDVCDSVRTIIHELRHAWQRKTDAYHGVERMERDARLYVLELNPPLSKEKLYRWLAEHSLDEPAPESATYSPPKATRPQWQAAPNKLFETVEGRIREIKDLLARLPRTPEYKTQRAWLTEELGQRLAQP